MLDVKNPISLARVILNASSSPLLLHRVPPNFLVGSGATDFAFENHLPVLPHDALIGDGAKERWQRWVQELKYAEAVARRKSALERRGGRERSRSVRRAVQSHSERHSATSHRTGQVSRAVQSSPPGPEAGHTRSRQSHATDVQDDGPTQSAMDTDPAAAVPDEKEDDVSDTVGAIAIDSFGNIAAGSSSGGIGMKHSGRIGPAALVGIGTAVIPLDPGDPEQAQVATVTSGTGEHIATTMAANTCALRMYYSQRRCADGMFEEVTEDEAMRGMIISDFLGIAFPQ